MSIVGIVRGDGVGEEVMSAALEVLETVAYSYGLSIDYRELIVGGKAIDRFGSSLNEATVSLAKSCDCILVGAIGGDIHSKWYSLPIEKRPEMGLLALRKKLDLYMNLRPVHFFKELDGGMLCEADDFEIMLIREASSGLYFGEKNTYFDNGIINASDTLNYSEKEIERIARRAFDIACKSGKALVCADKANVLETSRLWRMVLDTIKSEYSLDFKYIYAEKCAFELIKNPKNFDMIISDNVIGDILFGVLSGLSGYIGMLPSAYLGDSGFGIYEGCGGPAIDIAGQNIANPIANILSLTMMLEYSFGNIEAADSVKRAVSEVLHLGYRTRDIMADGMKEVSTIEMGEIIAGKIR